MPEQPIPPEEDEASGYEDDQEDFEQEEEERQSTIQATYQNNYQPIEKKSETYSRHLTEDFNRNTAQFNSITDRNYVDENSNERPDGAHKSQSNERHTLVLDNPPKVEQTSAPYHVSSNYSNSRS